MTNSAAGDAVEPLPASPAEPLSPKDRRVYTRPVIDCGGTGTAYNRGCRCDLCRTKAAEYMARYRKNTALRQWGHQLPSDLVDQETAVKLVWEATSVRGLNFMDIVRLTGVSKKTIEDIYHQRTARGKITRRTHDRIVKGLAREIRLDLHEGKSDTSLVDLDQYRWILYGLYAQGWTGDHLVQILKKAGRPHGWMIHHYEKTQIRLGNVKHLLWLAELIGDRQGPSRENKTRMRNRGHFPLIHYTETGRLIESSLTPEQKAAYRRVQSEHGEASGRTSADGLRS